MNNLYISHTIILRPNITFEHSKACLSVIFEILPGFISFAILLHAGYTFLVEKIFFQILLINLSRSKAKFANHTRITYVWVKIFSHIVVNKL